MSNLSNQDDIRCPIVIVLAIVFGILITFAMCDKSTYRGCLCQSYSYRGDDIYDCVASEDETSMMCAMDTGYFLCTYKSDPCWHNCTYYESDTINHPIYTCDTEKKGRERCFIDNKTCCWVSST